MRGINEMMVVQRAWDGCLDYRRPTILDNTTSNSVSVDLALPLFLLAG